MTEQSKLTIGTRIKDNDPRVNVERTIVGFFDIASLAGRDSQFPGATHVFAENALGSRARVRIDRIHADGHVRRSGWSVVV